MLGQSCWQQSNPRGRFEGCWCIDQVAVDLVETDLGLELRIFGYDEEEIWRRTQRRDSRESDQ